jgi:hypothetical protein
MIPPLSALSVHESVRNLVSDSLLGSMRKSVRNSVLGVGRWDGRGWASNAMSFLLSGWLRPHIPDHGLRTPGCHLWKLPANTNLQVVNSCIVGGLTDESMVTVVSVGTVVRFVQHPLYGDGPLV